MKRRPFELSRNGQELIIHVPVTLIYNLDVLFRSQVGHRGKLSPRQDQVLKCILARKSNKEIAADLNIAVRTVKFHVSELLARFKVESRAELIRQMVPDDALITLLRGKR